MSKIAIRGGHDHKCVGASGVVDEVTEDRKIYPYVIKYLKQLGHTVADVTPNTSDTSCEDLVYGVSRANTTKVDYFASIHLNSGGGHGCEVLYQSAKGQTIANKICAKLGALGFTNRGAKTNDRQLYELLHTNAVANIIEVIFCDSANDVALYRKVGLDAIGKAIAQGINEGLKAIK